MGYMETVMAIGTAIPAKTIGNKEEKSGENEYFDVIGSRVNLFLETPCIEILFFSVTYGLYMLAKNILKLKLISPLEVEQRKPINP